MHKLSDKEVQKKGLLVDFSTYSSLCRRTKEVKEILIKDLNDVKEAAALLETKNWVATYAVSNEDHVIVVLNKIL